MAEIPKSENKTPANPVLSIIIVNYNVKEYILNCIQSIQDKIDANRCPYEIIVSDNGSVDGSVEAIRERFPWVKVIENNTKYGFGKANNIGAKQAKGEVLFFLNPDTLIIKGIEEMVEYILRNREVGVINPLIVDEHDEFENSYIHYKIASSLSFQLINLIYPRPFYIRWNRKHINNVNEMNVFKIERFYGCAFLIKRNLFEGIRYFDENIFIYFEEEDIFLRLKKE
jgi:GT2 family glycosyltransferase